MNEIGKFLIIFGLLIVLIGFILIFAGKIPLIGKLPGDIVIERKNFTLYLPIGTSIFLSIILSVIFFLLSKK